MLNRLIYVAAMNENRPTHAAKEYERRITFEITTPSPLPVGQQVFISGNIEMLGAWQPDGFPLTRMDDNLWTGYAVIPTGSPIEFKITRGLWHTEEADADGNVRVHNQTLAEHGNVAYRHKIIRWLDRA